MNRRPNPNSKAAEAFRKLKEGKSAAKQAHRKVKLKSISQLKREADRVTSIRLRQSAADSAGVAACYTCGKRAPWQQLQCGHHMPRHHSATRYDFDNLRVQCAGCNVWGRGKAAVYAQKLIEEIGIRRYKALLARANQTHQFTRQELDAIITKYQLPKQ